MSNPPQKYLRSLPSDELVRWVAALAPGREVQWKAAWIDYNDGRGFYGDGATFRYAAQKAGLRLVGTGRTARLVKPPRD